MSDELRAAGDALADELERSTGISDPDVQALVATYRAACDAAPADEIDRLRARVAELEAASPDDAHTSTETRTEWRVSAGRPDGDRYVDVTDSEDVALRWSAAASVHGWTDVRVESRTVSTTTRTTAWEAER